MRRDALPLDTAVSISILVAARNEAHSIVDCLVALDALHYPQDKLQILIGEDDSTDDTLQVVQAWIADKPQFQCIPIRTQLAGLRGKQNVLAQLAQAARGDLLLITDADIRVHPDWAAGMAGAFRQPNTGIVCGPTVVWGSTLFAKVQGLDWMMGQALACAHTRLGIPISAVGNNMAVRREAYLQMGGYEALPFNIIEDYAMFRALCVQRRWDYRMVFHPGLSALSLPMENVGEWLRQRKRWFRGARALAPHNIALIVLNALVLPALIAAGAVLPPVWAYTCMGLKLLADFFLLWFAAHQLSRKTWLIWFIPYECYYLLSMLITPILMLLPGKIRWKGRAF